MSTDNLILEAIKDPSVDFYKKVGLVSHLHRSGELSVEQIKQQLTFLSKPDHTLDEMMSFGTVWIRKIYFPMAGGVNEDHVHDFDHVTCIAHGGVRVFIDGAAEGKDFYAPNFVMVRAGHSHHMMALEDETLMFCIHAHGIEGGVEMIDDQNDPMVDFNSARPKK